MSGALLSGDSLKQAETRVGAEGEGDSGTEERTLPPEIHQTLSHQEHPLFVLLDAWQMLLMKQMDYWDTYGQALALQAAYDYETEQ